MPSNMNGARVCTTIGGWYMVYGRIVEHDWDTLEVILVNEFDESDLHLVPMAALRFI